MQNLFSFVLLIFIVTSCFKGKSVDAIIHNARIHTMNEKEDLMEAIAIKDGRIVEVGPERQILNKYTSDEEIDAQGKDIYPGFTDAHLNIILAAKRKLMADLTGTRSAEELVVRLVKYAQLNNSKFIVGHDLDVSIWNSKNLNLKEVLTKQFSTLPICIYLSGNEELVVNDIVLKKAKINSLTGILKGEELTKVEQLFPSYSKRQLKKIVFEIQDELMQYGITSVHEAGLDFENIALFQELAKSKQLKLNFYGMLSPSEANYAFAKKHKKYRLNNFQIRSFCADSKLDKEALKRISIICESYDYQLSINVTDTESVNSVMHFYSSINAVNKDHRWRMDIYQSIDNEYINKLIEYGIFPSVQIVANRVSTIPLRSNSLLQQIGMLAIGSNYPYESFSPFYEIHKHVQRRNKENSMIPNFSSNEALTLDKCIKSLTTWSAFASFQETEFGILEKGKQATLSIFEFPVASSSEYQENYSWMTFIKGEKVYSAE